MSTTMTRSGGCSSCGASPSSPCDCSVATCGCGMPDCSRCAEGFVRPRFFGGQLLTEEDLQLLTQYVAGKNRLHNRFLFGDGVVCGLEVTCNPCSDSKILVKPGYALDCCGNDIVVTCEQTLDALALMRQLRDHQLSGYDCKDPCAKTDDAPGKLEFATHHDAAKISVPDAPQRYCLYLRYCEQLDELVMPYAATDACGRGECEATRVREGFRFELRCHDEAPPPVDILSRLLECFHWLSELQGTTRDAAKAQRDALELEQALTAQKSAQLMFTKEHATRLRAARLRVDEAILAGAPTAEALVSGAEYIAQYAGMHQRLADAVDGDQAEKEFKLGDEVANKETVLADASLWLEQGLKGATPAPTALEASYVKAVDAMIMAQDDPDGPDARLWVEGVAYSTALQSAYVNALANLQQTLLRQIGLGKASTDCQLRCDVAAIKLPTRGAAATTATMQLMVEATVRLVVALMRLVLDCICMALNPPCPPCDDPGVLIACFDVEDCKVTTICNTSRKYVLTANAMRYWVPLLGWLGELFEHACCTLRGRLASTDSYAGLIAMLGVKMSGGKLSANVGSTHALAALGGFYRSRAPSQTSLMRLPEVLTGLMKIATTRLGIVDDGAIAQPPVATGAWDPEYLDAIRTETSKTFAKQWPSKLDTYVGPKVAALVNEQVPARIEEALTSEIVSLPVTAYLASNLRREMKLVAQPLLLEALRPAVETIARERIATLAKAEIARAVEAETGPRVTAVVEKALPPRIDELLRVRAPEVISSLAAAAFEDAAGSMVGDAVSAALDETLDARVAHLMPATLVGSLREGEGRSVVMTLVHDEVSDSVDKVRDDVSKVDESVAAVKKSISVVKSDTTKKLKSQATELKALHELTAAMQKQISELTTKLGELSRG